MVNSWNWYRLTNSSGFANAFFKLLEELGYGYFHTCLIYAHWRYEQDFSIEEPFLENDIGIGDIGYP